MYHSPNSLDINIKNSNNTNTHINFNFNINSSLEKKFMSPPDKTLLKEPPYSISSITGRKIESNTVLTYEKSSQKYPILIEDSKKKSNKPLPLKPDPAKIKSKSLSTLKNQAFLKNFLEKHQEKKPVHIRQTSKIPKENPKKSKKKVLKKKKKPHQKLINFNDIPTENHKNEDPIKLLEKHHKNNNSTSNNNNNEQAAGIFSNAFLSSTNPNFSKNKKTFEMLLKKNLKKHRLEKLLYQQHEEIEFHKRVIKQESLHQYNQNTRKLNSLSSKRAHLNAFTPKYPWGFDQKKFFTMKIREKGGNNKKKPVSLWQDEKTRREQLGVGFLNEIPSEKLQVLLQQQKIEAINEKNTNELKKTHKESNPEVLTWMNEKRKKIEEDRWFSIKAMLEEHHRIKKNMQELEVKVSNSRNSVKSSSNARSKYAKSTHFLNNYANPDEKTPGKKLATNEENQIYELLQKELQEMVYNSTNNNNNNYDNKNNNNNSESNRQNNEFSSGKHMKSKSEDFNHKLKQKKQKIVEKFQILSQKMASTLGAIKSKTSSQESNPRKNEEINDRYSANANKFRNPNKNLHQNLVNPSEKSNKNTNNSEFSSPKQKSGNLSPNAEEIASKSLKNEENDESQDQFTSEEAMFYLFNTAATIIQKIWKGYHTRKMLNYYIIMALKELNPEENELEKSPSQEVEEKKLFTPVKSTKILRKSHSLDDIYEAGNLFPEDEKKSSNKGEKVASINTNNKLDAVFNEEEKEELKQKLSLLKNQQHENFDYYQLGNKNEEIQFDIKANEQIPKIIDNNLFYGKKNPQVIENKPDTLSKKDLDKSEHITNVSHLIEDAANKANIISDKNVVFSNININLASNNNFQDRKSSLENENEPEPEDLKELVNQRKQPNLKWEEFIEYMKICCQKPELFAPAQKLLETLQNAPISTLKSLAFGGTECKDQEIQTFGELPERKNQETETLTNPDLEPNTKHSRKKSKNLQIEIDEEEDEKQQETQEKNKEKNTEKNKEKNKELANENERKLIENSLENNEKIDNPLTIRADEKVFLGEIRRMFGSEQILRSQSYSLTVSPAENKSSVFELNPFHEFTTRKLREFFNKDNILRVIRFREKALTLRHQAQIQKMKEMLENRRVSPRTFRSKSEEIDKWANLEREDLLRKKLDIEKGWLSAAMTMRRTQRDLIFMRKSLNKSSKNPLQKSFSNEDFELFESFEDYKVKKLEKEDEVLKASNEKNQENFDNIDVLVGNGPEPFEKINEYSSLNKQLTGDSCPVNSPKAQIESLCGDFNKISEEPLRIPLENSQMGVKKSKENSKTTGTCENKSSFEGTVNQNLLESSSGSAELKRNSLENYELLRQKIAEIPKFLSHEDFGSLSGSSGNVSLSNSKSDMVLWASKNKENEKKIEIISNFVLENLFEELKNDKTMTEVLKTHKITNSFPKSPKIGGFVAGKDIQEHFPPLNSPSKEESMGNKRFKEQIISPKNLSIVFFDKNLYI